MIRRIFYQKVQKKLSSGILQGFIYSWESGFCEFEFLEGRLGWEGSRTMREWKLVQRIMLFFIFFLYKVVSLDSRLKKMLSEIEFLREENDKKIDFYNQDYCVLEIRQRRFCSFLGNRFEKMVRLNFFLCIYSQRILFYIMEMQRVQ